MKLIAIQMIRLVILALLCCSCHQNNEMPNTEQIPATKTEFSQEEQVQAAEALVRRVAGKASSSFKVVISPELKEGRDLLTEAESAVISAV